MKHLVTLVRSLLLVALLITTLSVGQARAQAPAWQTATPVATAANVGYTVTATVPDAAGTGLYVAGYFSGTVAMGGALLTSAGGNDLFVGKWNVANQRFVWVQRAGGTGNDQALGLAVRGPNVYVSGVFVTTATFGALSVSSGGAADGFVAKLVDAGAATTFAWVLPVGGANEDRATAVAVRGANVYLTGTFRSPTAILGSLILNNSTASGTAAGLAHIFITKLDDAGPSATFVWARALGGATADDAAAALAVTASGVYLAGDFSGNLNSGGNTLLTSSGGREAYVLKLADSGNNATLAWAKKAGGPGPDGATALAVNGASVYVAGFFNGLAIFDISGVVSNGPVNAFVAKLTDAGASATFTWVQQAGGTGSDAAYALAVSGTDVYVAGGFSSAQATFDTTVLTNAAAPQFDVFVVRLADAGPASSFVWAQRAGGSGNDLAVALSVLGSTVYVGGSATPPATFGSLPALSSPAVVVGFLASLLTSSPLATATPAALAGLSLLPNPAHGTATVQLPAVPGTATATLTIIDALGRTLRTQTASPNARTELDLTGLVPGLYAVRVAAGAATATQRLVVE